VFNSVLETITIIEKEKKTNKIELQV